MLGHTHSRPEGITGALAEFASETRYRDLPRDVAGAGQVVVLDGLGCMIAGLRTPVARILLDYVAAEATQGPCTVVGRGACAPAYLAAFVNGALLHVNDYEVQGQPGTHGTSNLLPVTLALAEAYGYSGADVLTAFIVGWEVQARIRKAATRNLRGFHPPGVFGPIGAAAAAGNLLRLSSSELRMAFGIAASRAGGLFANNGTMTKSTHPGNAGRMGLEAAALAKLGFTAHEDIFAASNGYVDALFQGKFDGESATQGLGSVYQLINPGFTIKPYPAEIFMQWIMEAVHQLRMQEGLTPSDVLKLEIEVGHRRDDLFRPMPTSGLDGKFSYQYCAAVALTQDRIGVDSFSDEIRFSQLIDEALPKIVVRENPQIPTTTADTWAVARARLRGGRVIESRCDAFRGSPRNPMTRDERLAKLRDCTMDSLSEVQFLLLVDAAESLAMPGNLERIAATLRTLRHHSACDPD